jgi:hypothetical protein
LFETLYQLLVGGGDLYEMLILKTNTHLKMMLQSFDKQVLETLNLWAFILLVRIRISGRVPTMLEIFCSVSQTLKHGQQTLTTSLQILT